MKNEKNEINQYKNNIILVLLQWPIDWIFPRLHKDTISTSSKEAFPIIKKYAKLRKNYEKIRKIRKNWDTFSKILCTQKTSWRSKVKGEPPPLWNASIYQWDLPSFVQSLPIRWRRFPSFWHSTLCLNKIRQRFPIEAVNQCYRHHTPYYRIGEFHPSTFGMWIWGVCLYCKPMKKSKWLPLSYKEVYIRGVQQQDPPLGPLLQWSWLGSFETGNIRS